jgi:hypothetical protein
MVKETTALDRCAIIVAQLDETGDPLDLVFRPTMALALAGLVGAGMKDATDARVVTYGRAYLQAVRVHFKDAPAVLALLDATEFAAAERKDPNGE